MKVLITRPEGQHQSLQAALVKQGHQVFHIPLLNIEPLELTPVEKSMILDLDRFAGVIVISPNAARLGLSLMEAYWPMWPVRQHWLCPGEGTAEVLREYGLKPIAPRQGNRSEDLLELSQLQQVSEQHWLIVKGQDGRDLIASTLAERGAVVKELPVYRRVNVTELNTTDQAQLVQADLILISSAQALDNLNHLADDRLKQSVHLLVSSPRLAEKAQQSGWHRIHCAQGATDSVMAQAASQLTVASN